MKKFSSQNTVGITALMTALFATTLGFADMMQNTSPVSQQVNNSNMSADQKSALIANRVDQITTKNVNGTLGGKLPDYLHNAGFDLDIDFIYWRTDEQGMTYAVLTTPNTTPAGPYQFLYSEQDVDFGFDPGFRIGLGYTFGNVDQWNLFLDWTYFHNDENTSSFVPTLNATTVGGVTQPYLTSTQGAFQPDQIASSESRWVFNYNRIDIELGRDFFIGRSTTFRPHWGISAAWLNQSFRVNNNGFYTSSPDVPPLATGFTAGGAYTCAENNFHGVALRTGIDMRWMFNKNFGLFGQAAAALYYGRQQNHEKILGNVPNLSSPPQLVSVSSYRSTAFNDLRPELEAAFGLEWCTYFSHDTYRLAIDAAWEIQEWFNQNQIAPTLNEVDSLSTQDYALNRAQPRWYFPSANGNLGIQGFTLKFRLDF